MPASNFAGSSPQVVSVVADVADHVPADQERLHREQQLRAAPEEADPARAAHLVARDGDEVGAERLDVEAHVRRRLRARRTRGSRRARAPTRRARGMSLIVPSELETKPAATTFTLPPRASGRGRRAAARRASSSGIEPELGARALRDVLPRHEVRVVLELGREHDVAGAEVREPPGVGDEVDRLGRVADEDDLARRRRVDERARLLARALERRGRALGRARRRCGARSRTTSRRTPSSRRAPAAASASSRRSRGTSSGLPWISCSKIGKSARSRAHSSVRMGLYSHVLLYRAAFGGRWSRLAADRRRGDDRPPLRLRAR